MRSGIFSSTVTRITEPKRRRRTKRSMVSSRSSASSSWMASSASRVTRKGYEATTSIPANNVSRCAAMMSSSQVNQLSTPPAAAAPAAASAAGVSGAGTGTSRGSDSGTFTRANRSSPLWSRMSTARLWLMLEMCGKGRPGSNARGVSTGNTWVR